MSLVMVVDQTNDEWAAAVRRRDPDAWARLVDAQHRRVYNLHLRLVGDRDTAADLTQETFAAAWQGAGSYRGLSRPETWLHAVALNCQRNWRRRTGRREVPAPLVETLPDPAPSPADLVALRQDSRRVCEAVAALPETYRRAVVLRYFTGANSAEIAAVEGTSPSTVRWRLHQAVKQLWSMLGPQAGEEQSDGSGTAGRVHLAP